MIILNVNRAGRNGRDYMRNLIHCMYQDERGIFLKGYGVPADNAGITMAYFNGAANLYQRYKPILVHYLELFVDYSYGRINTEMLADAFGKHIYMNGFQNLISIVNTGESYVITAAINAYSFYGNQVFYDNNRALWNLIQYLESIVPEKCQLRVTENTIFTRKQEGNYIHGMYQ